MRKDLRLGLGIGALALLFGATFLVVRNHTEHQAENEPNREMVLSGDGSGTPPAANLPAAAPGAGGAPLPTVILPPLQPVPTAEPSGSPPAGDPWARQPFQTPETPIPGPPAASRASRGNGSGWDLLLNEGRRDGTSSAALNREPDARLSTDPINSATAQPEPNRRAGPAVGEPSGATGRPYTIRSGDTFSSLARQQYGSEKYYLQIEQANPNVNTLRLRPGQQIILPALPADTHGRRSSSPLNSDADNAAVGRNEYRVDAGDSLYKISMKLYGTPQKVDALYEANRAAIGSDPDRLRLGMILRLPREARGSK